VTYQPTILQAIDIEQKYFSKAKNLSPRTGLPLRLGSNPRTASSGARTAKSRSWLRSTIISQSMDALLVQNKLAGLWGRFGSGG
jgi:hypothetical protein